MADLKIRVLADAAQARRELASTEKQVGAFSKGVGKLGTVAKAGFAAAAVGAGVLGAKVVGFTGEAVQAASDLEQSTGAVEAVFGKQAAAMKKNAEGAAQAFGLSKNSYQELATVLGAGLKNQGIKDFGGETQKVIGLGADLAAQFGGSTKEAVESIASLMRGEADPIEKYGVSIKETAINAELAATGQNKLKGAALDQAKAQARLAILFRQTSSAQGAFAREGDTLATKQQKNAAAWENLKAKLGTVFLPVMVKVQEFLANKVLPVVEDLFTWIAQNAPPAIAAVKGFLSGLQGGGTAAKYLEYVKTAFSTIAPVIQGLVTAAVSAWPAIQTALGTVFDALKSVMTVVGQLWALFGPTIVTQVTNVFTLVAGIIGGAFQVIGGIFRTISAVLSGDWGGALRGVLSITQGFTTIIVSIFRGFFAIMDVLLLGSLTRVKNFWVNAWNSVRTFVSTTLASIRTGVATAMQGIQSKVSTVLATVKNVWSLAWGWLKTKLSEAWAAIVSTVSTKVAAVQRTIQGLKAKITGAFSGAGEWLRDAGRRIMDGLIGALEAGVRRVRSLLNSVTDSIPDWKGPATRDATLLFKAGKLIMGSLVNGLSSEESTLRRQLAGVTRYIEGALSPTLTPNYGAPTGLTGLAGVAGGGGTTYAIELTVQAGVGDPVEIGKEVIRVLDAAMAAGARRKAT